jgi:hypothetical protein
MYLMQKQCQLILLQLLSYPTGFRMGSMPSLCLRSVLHQLLLDLISFFTFLSVTLELKLTSKRIPEF